MSLPLLHAGRTNPGLSAALDLRFALDKSLTAYRGPTPSFSRASTGSYFDGSGVLRYANVNTILYSEQLENAYWFKSGLSISANPTVAPDGKTTADKVVENASSGIKYGTIAGGFSVVSGTTYTFSAYAKDSGRYFGFATNSTAFPNAIGAVFNLTNGTISNIQANTTASIQSVGNGWYRCIITGTANASATTNINFGISNDLNQIYPSYTGNGSSGYFLWGVQMEIGSTVGTYCPTTNAANSAPRFNHTYNGTSWVSRGLLVEEQRTNGFLQSNGFGNSPWSIALSRGTVTQNAASPDGTNNAWGAECTVTAPGGFYLVQSGLSSPSATYTFSFFAKKDNNGFVAIEAGETSNDVYVFFDLTNGLSGNLSSVGGYTNISHGLSDCGNGWYRCRLTFTKSNSNNLTGYIYPTCNSFSSLSCTSGQSNFIFGAQYETGSFATSYIGTTSSSTTRSADVCQITGSDFSGFWNGTEGSTAAEYDLIGVAGTGTFGMVFQVDDNTLNNRLVQIGYEAGTTPNNAAGIFVANGGVAQANMYQSSIGTNLTGKASFAYKANDFALSVNGASVSTDTSGSIPAVTQMNIGRRISDGYLNGHISRLRYYRKRLPNATLQLLSEPDPTLNLQFALNKTLTPVAGPAPSFSRASTGTYFDSTGTLKYANVNLLTYSEQFDNAAWTDKAGSTLYTNAAASPNGDLSADQLQLSNSGYYYQKKAYTTTGTHTFSVWLRSSSPTTTLLRLSNDAGTENSVVTCNVTTSWQRFSVTRSWSANPVNFYAGLDQRTVVGGPGTSTDVFIWGAQLELASSPSQYAKTEASTTAGPRFDHVYSGGQWVSKGLLVEEQRTNIILQSSSLSTSPWSNTDYTITSATSPDGTSNAQKLVAPASTATRRMEQSVTGTAASYTLSFYAKSAGWNFVQFCNGWSGSDYVNFDLSNGIVSNSSGAVGSISSVGNGWYRCIATFTAGSSTQGIRIIPMATSIASRFPSTTGDGVNGILVFGVQAELGSFPTSYIPTTTSSVTRSADVCQITGTSFNWMWNQGEGSVVAEFDRSMAGSVTSDSMIYIAAGTGAPSNIQNGAYITSGNITTYGYDSAFTYNFNHGSQLANTVYKVATAIKLNDFASSLNGLAVLTDNSGTVGTNERLLIGHLDWSGGNRLNGHIAKLIYYPARLTNTKLQQLST